MDPIPTPIVGGLAKVVVGASVYPNPAFRMLTDVTIPSAPVDPIPVALKDPGVLK